VGNVWAQPLDGSPGHRLTNFASNQIRAFQFSPNGKTLAVSGIMSSPTLFSSATLTLRLSSHVSDSYRAAEWQ
jgi:hypothetical protein